MAKIRTHYDNLKVTRNAPPEVIRAAYKSLSQKYHPDLNPENADAERIMSIINTSYEVLSDPDKRKKYDELVRRQELMEEQKPNINSQPQTSPKLELTSALKVRTIGILSHVLKNWRLYGFACLMLWIWASNKPSTPPPGPKPYQDKPIVSVKPEYVRPSEAPNGQLWPVSAGYVEGYLRLNASGLSTVTIDNSQNDSDVFVKLVSLDSAKAYPIRQFYIPAFGRFTLNKVTAGSYDIRYRDLNSGRLSRSEAFNLEEISTSEGTRFSKYTMTLYKVQNGNMQTYDLSEEEF